jgi:hypothetical protein
LYRFQASNCGAARKKLSVAHLSWEPGIPEGESTIYLERYNPARNDLWKLLNGSGKDGVSHPIPSPKKER